MAGVTEAEFDWPRLLAAGRPLALEAWYATPLDAARAAALQELARRGQREALLAGTDGFPWRLAEWVADFWLGHDPALARQSLAATATDRRQQALVELVDGQLRASRHLQGASEALRRGFSLALPLLEARAYFILLRRHELLAELSFQARPAPPATLAELLTEARVIRGLRQGSPPARPPASHDDTLG
ncbi:hypothetical protein QVG61_00525 [Thiohalobacter sp. IOR34]|uniref:hypothetical protein n=1 Tax=Thiohalobacter sp. IOR34 TaxID=3057176 RepID=UPI0025B09298|nr:hypothetical protein [Thiohalobacter sp. IOR34]WJW75608.1 hypothetical protein QVG61_00525 [Thiohalobacter sp. IOR34]